VKRGIGFLFGFILSSVLVMNIPLTVKALTVSPYVETPEEGEYKIGKESGITKEDGHFRLGTDFYIYIENPLLEETSELSTEPVISPASPLDSTSETEQEQDQDTQENNNNQTKNSSSLPKTGDYGMNKNGFLFASLLFGAGYLICDGYERKNEKKE
jgi:hypothetical protein